MIRLSKLTDYSSLILAIIEKGSPGQFSAAYIAKASSIPKPTCVKLLKLLVKGGILNSTQGPLGGYKLAKPANQISVKTIVEAIEGPMAITECGSNETICRLTRHCTVMARWREIGDQMNRLLITTTLQDLVSPYTLYSKSDEKIALLEIEE